MNTQVQLFAQAETTAVTAPAAEVATTQAVPAGGRQQQAPNPLVTFGPFIVLIGLFIYLSWRGQKKEAKRQQDMLNSIRKDSKVMTTGGLIGVVAEVKDDCYMVTFAPNVKIAVARNAISRVISQEDAAKDLKSEDSKK